MSLQEFSDNLSTLSYVSRRRMPKWIYDSKRKTFFGRTGLSWVLCLLYYLVFYSCLAAFFMGMLMVFLYIQIHDDAPARTGMQSILQLKPGLGLRPLVDVHKSLIKFATTDPQEYIQYAENINVYLETYHVVNSKPDVQFATCNGGVKVPDDPAKVCKFDLNKLNPCNKSAFYGFPSGEPCVIIKPNKIYGWLPDIIDSNLSPHVLVNCSGQNPADMENIGRLEYYPGVEINGIKYGVFEHTYFPFTGQPGYLGPLVAMKFTSLNKHVAVIVDCQLQNVRNAYEMELSFEIMVN